MPRRQKQVLRVRRQLERQLAQAVELLVHVPCSCLRLSMRWTIRDYAERPKRLENMTTAGAFRPPGRRGALFSRRLHDGNQRQHRQRQHAKDVVLALEARVAVLEEHRRAAGPAASPPSGPADQDPQSLFLVVRPLRKRRRIENLELLADLPAFEIGGELGVFALLKQTRIASPAACCSRASAPRALIRASAPRHISAL